VLQWLAIALYALDDPELRDHVLSALSPPIRAQLSTDLARVEEQVASRAAPTDTPSPPPPLSPPASPPPSPPPTRPQTA
jgi:hypothetical protein